VHIHVFRDLVLRNYSELQKTLILGTNFKQGHLLSLRGHGSLDTLGEIRYEQKEKKTPFNNLATIYMCAKLLLVSK